MIAAKRLQQGTKNSRKRLNLEPVPNSGDFKSWGMPNDLLVADLGWVRQLAEHYLDSSIHWTGKTKVLAFFLHLQGERKLAPSRQQGTNRSAISPLASASVGNGRISQRQVP